jgi:hypothetical protein
MVRRAEELVTSHAFRIRRRSDMPDSKKSSSKSAESNTPHDYLGNVANQDSSVRDAKVPDEKPDDSTIAQVEEVKE